MFPQRSRGRRQAAKRIVVERGPLKASELEDALGIGRKKLGGCFDGLRYDRKTRRRLS
jgi:hypothetical protein